MFNQFKCMVVKIIATPEYGKVFISIKAKSGANLTVATKNSIVQSLKQYGVASVRPVIIDPETTYITLNTSFKYDNGATTKDASTLETNVLSTITNYNNDTLENFTGVFRHSKLTEAINNADTSILSNITTVKMYKFTPTLNSALKYTVSFNNAFYNPHLDIIQVVVELYHQLVLKLVMMIQLMNIF